jgi:hypothetical protein
VILLVLRKRVRRGCVRTWVILLVLRKRVRTYLGDATGVEEEGAYVPW